MKKLFEEYGDLFIGIITSVIMLSFLIGGAFIGSSVGAVDATPHVSKGAMNAMGYEASKTDIGTTARKEMITDGTYQKVDVSCDQDIKVGDTVETKTLFTAVDSDGMTVSHRITHIYDPDGDVVPTVGTITFQKPGTYRCLVKLINPSYTRIVTICVTE